MKNQKCAEILGEIYCEIDAASKYKEVLERAISALSLFSDEEVAERKREVMAKAWAQVDGGDSK